jgi:uncharacterized protein involved in exopolysaccharide biosynthesis
MENSEEEDSGERGGPGFQIETALSYLSFARRAIRARWLVSAGVFIAGIALSVLAYIYFPRSYTCTTVIMAVSNPVLEDMNSSSNALTGASDLILRHENLENMVKEIGLVAKSEQRRPPVLKLKDHLIWALFGEPSVDTKIATLVGTLETRIDVTVASGDLTINADWSDAATSAELAETARESFLKARHAAEIAAFEEKMAILDGHASKLREEIETLAQQINTEQGEQAGPVTPGVPGAAPRPAARRLVAARAPATDTELPVMREQLEADRKKIDDLQADQQRRMRDEQAKLDDLKLRLTASHPQVITQAERVAMVSQPPPELAQLRADATYLAGEIKAHDALSTKGAGAASLAPEGGAEPLPQTVVQALEKQDTDVDRALSAQLSGAVVRYGALRDDIRQGRINLDTAQAAFNHRYQIIVPAEVPTKPKKPKGAVILGAGMAVSLLLALLLPVIAELKKGVMIERWQVEQMQLPILGELHLPPKSE